MIDKTDFNLLAGIKVLRTKTVTDALNVLGDKITKDAESTGELACKNFSVIKEVVGEERFKYIAGCIMLSMDNPCSFAFMLEALDNVIIPLCQTQKTLVMVKGGNA